MFSATTINYIDRALFSNLIPYFEGDLKLGPMDLAMINVSFLLAYGLGMTLVGRFIDRVGVRVGLLVAFLVWNVASVGHALVWSVGAFIAVRIILGIGEAGNFPSAIRTVAEWFPKKERALATGWFNCGSNIGAVVTPLAVVLVAERWGLGWRGCFALLGGVGVVWAFFWWLMYRSPDQHPKVNQAELAYIQQDPPDRVEKVGLLTLLGQRQVYAYSLGRFCTESPWWFYLTWMPKYLSDAYGLTGGQRAWAVAAIYLIADGGSIAGGWLSSAMIKRGYSINVARKVALLVPALGVLPMMAVPFLGQVVPGGWVVWIAVAIVALAASCHQAWSANMYTLVSDTLPKGGVATTVGLGTAFGSVGSSLFQFGVAWWLMSTGNYLLPFVLAGTMYLVGWAVVQAILPNLEVAKIEEGQRPRVTWWQVGAVLGCLVGALIWLQVLMNRPAYASEQEYYTKRASQIQATGYEVGPAAQVHWMEAKWIKWRLADGGTQWELIKFDRHGHPVVEAKGEKAAKYSGPTGLAQ